MLGEVFRRLADPYDKDEPAEGDIRFFAGSIEEGASLDFSLTNEATRKEMARRLRDPGEGSGRNS